MPLDTAQPTPTDEAVQRPAEAELAALLRRIAQRRQELAALQGGD